MIPFLSGLLHFLIYLFIYVCLAMLYVVVSDSDKAGFLLMFSPLAAVIGFLIGFRQSKAKQRDEDRG
jgi:hypothetical protein